MSDLEKKLEELVTRAVEYDIDCMDGSEKRRKNGKLIKDTSYRTYKVDGKEYEDFYAKNASTEVDEVTEQIKQALKDEGYARVDNRRYRDELGKEYRLYSISYADGSGEMVKLPQYEFMSREEWERQAVKDGWVKVPQVEVVTRWEAGGKAEVIMINGEEVKKKANTITVDLDVFEAEIKAQEFSVDEAEWKSLIKALKKSAGIE